MLDKWAFAMSKIDGDDTIATEKAGLSTVSRGPSTDLAAELGNVSLDTRAGYVGREHTLSHLNRRLRLLDPYLYLDQAYPKISNKYQALSCLSTLNRTNHQFN